MIRQLCAGTLTIIVSRGQIGDREKCGMPLAEEIEAKYNGYVDCDAI